MSRFNTKLDLAKSRQKRIYFAVGSVVTGFIILAVILFVLARGTRVEIMPEEAKASGEISLTEGFGFSVGKLVYSLSKNPVITVSAPGYKVATKTIDAARLGKVLAVTLTELPGRLVVELSNTDNDLSATTWRIHDRDVALARRLDLQLKAGEYTISVDNKFYHIKELKVEVRRGEETRLMEDLQPIKGQVQVASNPPGATLFVGAKEIGITPLQLDLKGGRYSLKLASTNHIDIVEELEITRTTPEVGRSYQLKRKKARVNVRLTPEGGTLFAGGRVVTGPLHLDVMVEHRLTYIKDGYYTKTETLTLKPDEDREISFNLLREMGQVRVESSPQAAVWLGSKNYGMTPVTLNLSAVSHQISLKKKGYRTVVKSVKPKGGAVQTVSAQLLTEYQARLQEAPQEYSNQSGITMKLFVIQDSFTMGAPRSEKGQRANEFQRRIRLTKPFYVSIYEITDRQYAKFNPERPVGKVDSPATGVTWQQAAKFCNWLSNMEKLRPFYMIIDGRVTGFDIQSDGYRLLSEAEWEWLARKSGKMKQTIFSWGNETIIPPQSANVADESSKGEVRFFIPGYNDGYSGVAPVGSFKKEPSGIYDLAGNVSEWVHDVYSIVPPTQSRILSNPLGQQSGQTHVVKGANWRSGTITTLRPAFREGVNGARDDVGFRVARYLHGGENE